MLGMFACFVCLRSWRTCVLSCSGWLGSLGAYVFVYLTYLACLRASVLSVLGVLTFLSNHFLYLLIAKIMVWQLKIAEHIHKCMLTDVNLKVKIVKDNNKFHEIFFGDNLNLFMPKTQKWSDTLSKSYSE